MTAVVIPLVVVVAMLLAALPAVLTLSNLRLFRPAPLPPADAADHAVCGRAGPRVSVLVPARNETEVIDRCAGHILASRGVDLELVVLDDGSTDDTAARVERLGRQDPRVRLIRGRPLPAGWCGKQHACMQLSEAATHETWVFLDADVVLSPDGIRRCLAFLDASGAALVSGFPRQETVSFLEWLLLPLIHFVLLGYLPLGRSRADGSPALAAGCGQLFVTRRGDYVRAGGHAAIRDSLHDGLKLPRCYRRAGLATDIFDATDLASCRMYTRSADVWSGLAKNATEGVGNPATILPFTVLLAGGHILPTALLVFGMTTSWRGWPSWCVAAAAAAFVLSYLPRVVDAVRFRQRATSVAAHPVAILVFLAIQWTSLIRRQLGLQTRWRGRTIAPP